MKVKVLKARLPSYWYAGRIGEIFEVDPVIREYYDSVGFKYKIQGEPKYIQEGDFEIVKDIQEFDMKKEAWFINFNNNIEYKLINKWLRGHYGKDCPQVFHDHEAKGYLTNICHMENEVCDRIMVGLGDDPLSSNKHRKEIKLIFKTIIDSVEYPSIETEQQKQIRELEETIAKAAEQIKSLKGEK